MDVRKSINDAGYIAVGVGVIGFQQAQVRRRQLQEHVQSAGSCVANRAQRAARTGSAPHGRNLDSKAREARGVAEGTVNQTVSRVQELAVRGHDHASSRSSSSCRPRGGAARAVRAGDRAGRGPRP